MASALGLRGRLDEAREALKKLLEMNRDFGLDNVLASLSPLDRDAILPRLETLIEGLRKAGLDIPDEPAAAD